MTRVEKYILYKKEKRRRMIYVFAGLLVISFLKEKDILLERKRNMFMFLILSSLGIALGVIHMVSPYIPSIAFALEKYLK